MKIDPNIYFIVVVPDDDPSEATVMQGFAPSLCGLSWVIRAAAMMPPDIFDLTPEGNEVCLVRRMSGQSPIRWYAQGPRTLRSSPHPTSIPFAVVVLPPSENLGDYREWLDQCRTKPTIVAREGGDLNSISVDALRTQFLKACDALPSEIDADTISEARRAIVSWTDRSVGSLGYKVCGHNSISPNLAALAVAGFNDLVSGPLEPTSDTVSPYVEQIVKTTQSIFDLRSKQGVRAVNKIFRLQPDLNLFAPAIYPHVFRLPPPSALSPAEKRRFIAVREALQRQSGYAFDVSTDAKRNALLGDRALLDDQPPSVQPHPILMMRSSELKLNTELMSALTASEFSACVRMPNDVNRTSGSVRAFAEHYRSDRPTSRKRLIAFRSVQARLAAAVPKEFIELIRRSGSGVRVVADAHIEWLDVDGLPLGIAKNCSRIPVTPGNLFVNNLAARETLHMTPEDFAEILVVTTLKYDDPIREIFRVAFAQFEPLWRKTLRVKFVDVGDEEELVEALNAYSGPMVIFDGHGSHEPNRAAMLHIRGTSIDVWKLKDRVRVPPIVVLSACDTHAADRNHATTANGFMALGARTVLCSVFPLLARDAAIFTARLVYRVADYIPAAIRYFRQGIVWTEVISGMLRMQLVTDFLRILERKYSWNEEIFVQIHGVANNAINGGYATPFLTVLNALEERGLERATLERDLELAIANSSVISYLQLGRPETIIIDDPERIAEQMHPSSAERGLAPHTVTATA